MSSRLLLGIVPKRERPRPCFRWHQAHTVTAEKQKSATDGGDQMGRESTEHSASQPPCIPALLLWHAPDSPMSCQSGQAAGGCGGAPEMSQVLQSFRAVSAAGNEEAGHGAAASSRCPHGSHTATQRRRKDCTTVTSALVDKVP